MVFFKNALNLFEFIIYFFAFLYVFTRKNTRWNFWVRIFISISLILINTIQIIVGMLFKHLPLFDVLSLILWLITFVIFSAT